MAVLLDTAQFPPHRRTNAIAEVIEFCGAPARIVRDGPDDEVQARFDYFTIGETHLLTSQASAQGLITTPALLRDAESDFLLVSLKLSGTATHTHAPGRLLQAGDIFTSHLWRPYEFFGDGGAASVHIPLDRLGLPREFAMRSGELVHGSPLAAQLQRHLQLLIRDAEAISQGPAAAMVGRATADLVRAALVSAAGEEPFGPDGLQPGASTVIKSYIAQNLADPDLGADQIARAMFVSVRQLYKIWETESRPLGQWITERRLEAARDELASPRRSNQTVAIISRRWGFADPTHFSRRFRQAYGMSPREWRHAYSMSETGTAYPGPGMIGPCTDSR